MYQQPEARQRIFGVIIRFYSTLLCNSSTMKNRKNLSHASLFLRFVIWKCIAHDFPPPWSLSLYYLSKSEEENDLRRATSNKKKKKKFYSRQTRSWLISRSLSGGISKPSKTSSFASVSTVGFCASLRPTSPAQHLLVQPASPPCAPPWAVLGAPGPAEGLKRLAIHQGWLSGLCSFPVRVSGSCILFRGQRKGLMGWI